jgi:hypothetical protein
VKLKTTSSSQVYSADLMGDLTSIQPFSAIIGAVITATVSFLVAYFLAARRKRLKIWIAEPEDLTRALRGHSRIIGVSADDQRFVSLNRCAISVRNVGNTNVDKFSFDIEIPGEHSGYLANVTTEHGELRQAVTISSHPEIRSTLPGGSSRSSILVLVNFMIVRTPMNWDGKQARFA